MQHRVHTYIHTYIHAYMHTCIHAYMHTCIHAYMHTCIHAYMHTCIHAYMHTCIHAYIQTYIHTYIHKHKHTYIHTYIHSYIHTQIEPDMLKVPRLSRKRPRRPWVPVRRQASAHIYAGTERATPATQIAPEVLKVSHLPRKRPSASIGPPSSPSFRGHLLGGPAWLLNVRQLNNHTKLANNHSKSTYMLSK